MLKLLRAFAAVAVVAGASETFSMPAGASQPDGTSPVDCTPLAGVSNPPQCPTTPTQPGGLDHFLCDQAVENIPTPLVRLQDQFGLWPAVQPLSNNGQNQLCTPVTKTLEAGTPPAPVGPVYGVTNPDAHLMCYADTTGAPDVEVSVANQFGQGTLTVGPSTHLCLPTWKYDPDAPTGTPGSVPPGSWGDPTALNLNHFQCYQIDQTSVSFPHPPTVTLADQFGVYHAVSLGEPNELCAPVVKTVIDPASGLPVYPPSDINGDGIAGPDAAHLLCFPLRAGVAHNVVIGNQFTSTPPGAPGVPGAVPVSLIVADQLCLPSLKALVTPPPGTPEAPFAALLPLAAVTIGTVTVLLYRRHRRGALTV